LQREVAQQLGVVRSTIRNWEKNRAEPTADLVPLIIAFLGYAPRVHG
jgi:DNA-binding XRE family transcriptional regulator